MTDPILLQLAIRALEGGELAPAEIAARTILDNVPDDAAALHLLGIIAARVQAFDQAQAYFQRALAAEPGNSQIAQNLAAVREAPRRTLPVAMRYLVIQDWGFGFWANVSQVLGSLLLAEITGRIPVTWWGKASLFNDGQNRDAFQLYFQPLSDVTLADLPDGDFFPPRWTKASLAQDADNGLQHRSKWEGKASRLGAVYFLNRRETVAVSDFYIAVINVMPWLPRTHCMHGKPLDTVWRYLTEKYLRPRQDIIAACDDFFARRLSGAPFVAAHLRGSDKISEDPNAVAINQAIRAMVAEIDPSWRILVLTDDIRCLAMMRETFGERVVATDSQRSHTDEGVHYLTTTDRIQAGREIMIDSYLALRADRFIGNGLSNVAAMIAILKDWPAGACTLLGREIFADRNLHLYQMTTRPA